MKPTQNNKNGDKHQPVLHQMPRRYAPDIDRIGKNPAGKSPSVKNNTPAKKNVPPKNASARYNQPKKRRRKPTLREAILAELEDRLDGISLIIPLTADQIIRGIICGALMITFALLQTTVFARFKPFGAVPDLMFALTVAIAFSEGEKWGGVCGLIGALIIDALSGYGITLLPLLYVAAGIMCGYLVRDFFSNTALPRIAVITLFTVAKSVISFICAAIFVDATVVEIMTDIIIPEYFSTVLMSAPVYLIVWLCFAKFHKTRAEKTAG